MGFAKECLQWPVAVLRDEDAPVALSQTAGASLTRACSRRSRLSRPVLAHGPRQPSSLLKHVVGPAFVAKAPVPLAAWGLHVLAFALFRPRAVPQSRRIRRKRWHYGAQFP